MNLTNKLFAALFIMLIIFFSCNQNKKNTNEKSQQTISEIDSEYKQLKDSVEYAIATYNIGLIQKMAPHCMKYMNDGKNEKDKKRNGAAAFYWALYKPLRAITKVHFHC